LILALIAALLAPAHADAPTRPFLAYHPSWFETRTERPEDTSLARLPGYLTHVALSFAKPDLIYSGDLDLQGTGLSYPYSGVVLKQAIALLKARNPQTRVLIAVGGSTYHGWDKLNEAALARLVSDLGADGVDIDYEPANPSCIAVSGKVRCADDALSIRIVERIRAALPRPLTISAAVWSIGAYGEGAFANSPPASPWRGVALAMLRSPAAAGLDLVSIMSYDAGPAFRAEEALRAYRQLWKGPLALGVRVMPGTSAGEPRFTIASTSRMLRSVIPDPKAGAMLYALLEVPPGPPGPDNPDYRSLATAICVTLELEDCSAPIP